MSGVRESSMRAKLTAELLPSHLEVINESHMHKGPPGRETHFRVVVVSPLFAEKSAVARHKLVYATLGDELRAGLHALAITSRTPEEWAASTEFPASPLCASKKSD
ncbi:MAG: BolA family protein [Polyangiaceae bacterium]